MDFKESILFYFFTFSHYLVLIALFIMLELCCLLSVSDHGSLELELPMGQVVQVHVYIIIQHTCEIQMSDVCLKIHNYLSDVK